MADLFTSEDLKQIVSEGLTLPEVRHQLELYKKGMTTIKLNRPCLVGDGLVTIAEEDRDELLRLYDQARKKGRFLKFVPASGAASRMFDRWRRVMDTGRFEDKEKEKGFSQELERLAFFEDLKEVAGKNSQDFSMLIDEKNYGAIISLILNDEGLGYDKKPKALIGFHRYQSGSRTPLEEHLVEGALQVKDGRKCCRIHFTASEEYKEEIEAFLLKKKDYYERIHDVSFQIDLSVQSRNTNTIAVNMDNTPFRGREGRLVFRPGGHGTLIKNLKHTRGDIVYIKNIDNVLPDGMKPPAILYKQMLGGYFLKLEGRIFNFLDRLKSCPTKSADVEEAWSFCLSALNHEFLESFNYLPGEAKREALINRLNRPFRVCGVVKNEGEPGGGPFFIYEEDGTSSVQIIEEFQVMLSDQAQRAIWLSATHFNPVDLVCGLRNREGESFQLEDYVDQRFYSVSKKTHDSRELKALEWPGLWNGAMGLWNTVFVEVPIETFAPVKTVDDLLRTRHQVKS